MRSLQYLSRSSQEHDTLLESLSGQKRRPLAPEVGRLRAIKSEAEQKVMRAAADISSHAHTKVTHLVSESAMFVLTST